MLKMTPERLDYIIRSTQMRHQHCRTVPIVLAIAWPSPFNIFAVEIIVIISNGFLSLCRMLWRITVPVILAGVLFITAETKKPQPQGSIPSPNKTKGNLSSERHQQLLQQKPEVLSSSREALVVTERRYLRRDWCKTQPLRQTISEEGCRSRTVVNRFCYGQCNSFYIPRHMGPSSAQAQSRGQASGSRRKSRNKSQEPFQSCSFCRPHRITQLTVQLDCPDLQPPFKHRKVQRVKQCRCMSVDVGGHGKLWRADRKQVKIKLEALDPQQTHYHVANMIVLEKMRSSSCVKTMMKLRNTEQVLTPVILQIFLPTWLVVAPLQLVFSFLLKDTRTV